MNRITRSAIGFLLALSFMPGACQLIPLPPESGEAALKGAHEAAVAPTHTTAFDPSKYTNVWVYTIEEIEHEGRSLLHVSIPVTEQETINTRMEAVAQEFIEEYRLIAAETEESYQEYKKETGKEAATFITHYRQSFDVSVANESLIFFDLERSIDTGGTGYRYVIGFIFDRRSGAELAIPDLFVDESYLERLSSLSREALSEQLRDEALLSDMDWIEDGTTPTAENFDNILVRDDGTVAIMFDKYQVAAGAEGIVEIAVPTTGLADLLKPEIRQLLGIEADEETGQAKTESLAGQSGDKNWILADASPSVGGLAFARTGFATDQPVTGLSLKETRWANMFHAVAAAEEDINCYEVACVALTFDDGPSVYTEGLLDILKEHGAQATFFILGKSARIQSETVIRMHAEGHEIGNHTWDHPNLTQLSDDLVRQQIQQTDEIVTLIIGEPTQHLRPPYGAYNDRVVAVAGLPIIFWSVDPLDWKDRDADVVAARIIESPAGAIILAHDIHKTTVAAVPTIIAALRERGIHFVTVSKLFQPVPLLAGNVYTKQPAPPSK